MDVAEKLEVIEQCDNFAVSRNKLRIIAEVAAEYAGLPMPIEGERLVIEKSYPFSAIFESKEKPEDEGGAKVRNVFWSSRWRTDIVVGQDIDGRIWHAPMAPANSLTHQLVTLGCSFAWGVAQEHAALQLLGTMLSHVKFKQYLLTGTFIERSKRSRLFYMFRKLRPTVAITEKNDRLRILCALCMHPIGYYEGSWAGAMCPTDDVIAHLTLMRGDEHMFWKRCNQIGNQKHNAGL